MGEDNNDNGEVVPDDRWTAFFVTSAFWIACLAWLIANIVSAARPSLLLHVVACLSFLLQGTYVVCGRVWTLSHSPLLQGPLCDCCCYSVGQTTWSSFCPTARQRARGCCGCTCMSRPYAVASGVFAVLLFTTPPAASMKKTSLLTANAIYGDVVAQGQAGQGQGLRYHHAVGSRHAVGSVATVRGGVGGRDPLRAMHKHRHAHAASASANASHERSP